MKLKDVAENWIVCRICLHQPSTGLESIFHQDDGKDLTLLIHECGGVPIKQFDHYPDKICTKCLKCLKEAYIFRKTCQHSHKRLSELIAPMDVDKGEQQRLAFEEEYNIEEPSNIFDDETKRYVPEVRKTTKFATKEGSVSTAVNSENQQRISNMEMDDGKNLELSVKLKEEIVENEMISEMFDAFDEAAEEFITENAIEKCSEIYYKKAEVNVQKNQKLILDNPFEDKLIKEDVTENAECLEELKNEPCISSIKQKCLRGSNTYISADTTQEEILPNIKETFDCNVCRITFALDQDLMQHVKKIHKKECKTYTNERPYACDICNKPFYQKGGMITHKFRVHKVSDCNLKTFKCGVCENTFFQKAHLDRHMRIHTGERPYKCSYCPKAFSDSSSRNSHHRTHTNERPYACDCCGLSFAVKPTLRRHKIRAHQIY